MTYRFPIINGDRVALAPHLDLWMSGVRYGQVVEQMVNEENERMYCVVLPNGRTSVWLTGEDLLGAVNRIPGDPTGNGTSADAFGARASTVRNICDIAVGDTIRVEPDWHREHPMGATPSTEGGE